MHVSIPYCEHQLQRSGVKKPSLASRHCASHSLIHYSSLPCFVDTLRVKWNVRETAAVGEEVQARPHFFFCRPSQLDQLINV